MILERHRYLLAAPRREIARVARRPALQHRKSNQAPFRRTRSGPFRDGRPQPARTRKLREETPSSHPPMPNPYVDRCGLECTPPTLGGVYPRSLPVFRYPVSSCARPGQRSKSRSTLTCRGLRADEDASRYSIYRHRRFSSTNCSTEVASSGSHRSDHLLPPADPSEQVANEDQNLSWAGAEAGVSPRPRRRMSRVPGGVARSAMEGVRPPGGLHDATLVPIQRVVSRVADICSRARRPFRRLPRHLNEDLEVLRSNSPREFLTNCGATSSNHVDVDGPRTPFRQRQPPRVGADSRL